MEILIILVLFSIAVAGSFLGAFIWAFRSGQFDDMFTPSVRVLFDKSMADQSTQNQKTQR